MGRLVARHQGAVGLAHAALHRVLDGHHVERAHRQAIRRAGARRAAEAPRQAAGDPRVADLVALGASRRAHQLDGGAVRAQLGAKPAEGVHRRGLEVRGRGEVIAQRRRGARQAGASEPGGDAAHALGAYRAVDVDGAVRVRDHAAVDAVGVDGVAVEVEPRADLAAVVEPEEAVRSRHHPAGRPTAGGGSCRTCPADRACTSPARSS